MQEQAARQPHRVARGHEGSAAADLQQSHGREPDQREHVYGRERTALLEQAREHQKVGDHHQHELIAVRARLDEFQRHHDDE